MPKLKVAPVDQLRILNELLGRVSDPHKAEHARRALEFAYNEHPEDLERVALGDHWNLNKFTPWFLLILRWVLYDVVIFTLDILWKFFC